MYPTLENFHPTKKTSIIVHICSHVILILTRRQPIWIVTDYTLKRISRGYICCTKNWNMWWYNFLHHQRWGHLYTCYNSCGNIYLYLVVMEKFAAAASIVIAVTSLCRRIINLLSSTTKVLGLHKTFILLTTSILLQDLISLQCLARIHALSFFMIQWWFFCCRDILLLISLK